MVHAMLERAQGLSTTALEAIARLERRVLATDAHRLKLEWSVLRSRSADEVKDLLWWEGGDLVGYVGIYDFGWPTLELAGMVDPGTRRRGIGGALLDAALAICRTRDAERVLVASDVLSVWAFSSAEMNEARAALPAAEVSLASSAESVAA